MLLLFLALQVFSASPTLHHALHNDSDSPNHQCAISLLSHGMVDHTPLSFSAAAVETFVLQTIAYQSPACAYSDFRTASNRGPPVLL